MDNIESYLILKYGTLYQAYVMWLNTYQTMDPDLHDIINEYFSSFRGLPRV